MREIIFLEDELDGIKEVEIVVFLRCRHEDALTH